MFYPIYNVYKYARNSSALKMVTDMVSLCPPLITRTLPRRAEPSFVSKPPVELFVVVFSLILEKSVFIMGDVKKKKMEKNLKRRKQNH